MDDGSDDETIRIAARMGVDSFLHINNLGYGANQKTCYREALRAGADVVVMLHPDYQYDPRLVGAFAAMVASEVYDVALGSRILGSSSPYPFTVRRSNRTGDDHDKRVAPSDAEYISQQPGRTVPPGVVDSGPRPYLGWNLAIDLNRRHGSLVRAT